MKKFFTYLKYVLVHKFWVFIGCCKQGMPITGLVHDMSKFLPSEFIPYMHHFGGGIQAGRDKTGYYKPEDTKDPAFEFAWFLHSRRNRHHWQYWVLPLESGKSFKVHEMPMKYRKEMLADWYGASKVQKTSGIDTWWKVNKHKLVLGKETRIWFDWMVNCPIGTGSCTRRVLDAKTKSK